MTSENDMRNMEAAHLAPPEPQPICPVCEPETDCPECGGGGVAAGEGDPPCPWCEGRGEVPSDEIDNKALCPEHRQEAKDEHLDDIAMDRIRHL